MTDRNVPERKLMHRRVRERGLCWMIRHYRYPFRLSYLYLFVTLCVLVMSWETQRTDAAVADAAIPEQSIRLRILANSDSAADQAVKRHVRDAVVEAMNGWVSGPQTIGEARAEIRSRMADIERIVEAELRSRGFAYGFRAELAVVPFPTKIYGKRVYPAGDYEALRITLGEGQGQNWWCVLFPPLCFVDSVTGEATAASATADGSVSSMEDRGEAAGAQTPEARFFLWELIQSVLSFIRSLFV